MDQNQQSMTNPEQESTFSVITVPEHLREQVVQHVTELMQQDSDVSGYMIGGLVSHSMGRSLAGGPITATGCSTWDTKGSMDLGCSDSD